MMRFFDSKKSKKETSEVQKEEIPKEAPLPDLPNEMLFKILFTLDNKTLRQTTATVSQRWANMTRDVFNRRLSSDLETILLHIKEINPVALQEFVSNYLASSKESFWSLDTLDIKRAKKVKDLLSTLNENEQGILLLAHILLSNTDSKELVAQVVQDFWKHTDNTKLGGNALLRVIKQELVEQKAEKNSLLSAIRDFSKFFTSEDKIVKKDIIKSLVMQSLLSPLANDEEKLKAREELQKIITCINNSFDNPSSVALQRSIEALLQNFEITDLFKPDTATAKLLAEMKQQYSQWKRAEQQQHMEALARTYRAMK